MRKRRAELSAKDRLDFWQKEAHNYERRAGEQGLAAVRLVGLSAPIGVALPAFAAYVAPGRTSLSLSDAGTVALMSLPVVIVLLFFNAIRLFHEMQRLRQLADWAEQQVAMVARLEPSLAAYSTWYSANASVRGNRALNVLTVLLAILLGAGALGLFVNVASGYLGDYWWVALAIALGVVALLGVCAGFIYRDARIVRKQLQSTTQGTWSP